LSVAQSSGFISVNINYYTSHINESKKN
jgi:hypothetical protein